MAACTAAIPPSPSAPATSAAPAPSATVEGSRSRSSEPPAPDPDDLAAQVQIGSIDPALTHPVLEFRSDGESIVFSSRRAPDAGPDGAPDLWRIVLPGAEPELLWRNPERNHAIVSMAVDLGAYAFVEMPLTGERAWTLWVLPRDADEAIRLDRHPGDGEVPSLVPSVALYEDTVVWTAFDRGSDGPVSQLRVARAPDWAPRTIRELPADEAEIWLPSLRGSTLAYMEVHYRSDRTADERRVFLSSTAPGAQPRRLDASGRATMPVVVEDAVLWKESDPGFSMFNWGRMYRYDLATETVRRLRVAPQQYVNYPSAGHRFVAWWGADSFQLGVYDLVRDEARLLLRSPIASQESKLRPHIAGDLLVWMHAEGGVRSELRYAFLPGVQDP